MPVSQKERNLAKLIDRNRRKVEAVGVRAARKLNGRIIFRTLQAVRRGQDPIAVFRREIQPMEALILDARVAGHLDGISRSNIERAKQPKSELSFASTTAFRKTLNFFVVRAAISQVELAGIEAAHRGASLRAFSVTERAVQGALEQTISGILVDGLLLKDGIERIRETFKAVGMSPDNSFTFENLFRTQTQLGHSAGRWQSDQSPEIQEILIGYKYITVGDNRVRPNHAALDGVTLLKDDPRWDTIFPPNGFSCRCQIIPIFEERKIVEPVPKKIDGKVAIPEADKGFRFNPGKVLAQ